MITMQSWMFLSSYEKLRQRILSQAPLALHGSSWRPGLRQRSSAARLLRLRPSSSSVPETNKRLPSTFGRSTAATKLRSVGRS